MKRAASRTALEAGAIAALAGWNLVLNRRTPPVLTVPASVAAALSMLLYARVAGVKASELGLGRDTVRRGVIAGAACGVPLAAVAAFVGYLPLTRQFFADLRVSDAPPTKALYELGVRIPIATALCEELMFRSALEGILSTGRSAVAATGFSALVFGAWHILPANDRVESNARSGAVDRFRRTTTIAGVVAITAGASVALSVLRRKSGSVIAPAIVHYAINAGGFAGVWLAARGTPKAALEKDLG